MLMLYSLVISFIINIHHTKLIKFNFLPMPYSIHMQHNHTSRCLLSYHLSFDVNLILDTANLNLVNQPCCVWSVEVCSSKHHYNCHYNNDQCPSGDSEYVHSQGRWFHHGLCWFCQAGWSWCGGWLLWIVRASDYYFITCSRDNSYAYSISYWRKTCSEMWITNSGRPAWSMAAPMLSSLFSLKVLPG